MPPGRCLPFLLVMEIATLRSWTMPHPPQHVSPRKEDTFMKDFWKKLLVRQPDQGASATLPELDGMP